VATEAANTFEEATIETEVFSNRVAGVHVDGEDAERRHAVVLGIFAKLQKVGCKFLDRRHA
jgi:hypothetical protein